jgi:flavin reductase (DIM6/NTAB) family NADH-FMN oxidoreductase RutF/DNA-binding IclR family transcriptional regulator
MSSIDSKELRKTLGAFTTGVTVITTSDAQGRDYGVTANSFSSVSLDPPLVLWSQAITSRSHPAFRDADRFVVNIMAEDQHDVSNRFAKSGDDKFVGLAVTRGLGGLPVIEGTAAHLECRKVAQYPGGDHVVYLGEVENMLRAPRRALAFGEGRYLVTFAHDLGGNVGDETGGLIQLDAVRLASAALPEICESIGQRTVGIAVWGNRGATMVRWEPSKTPVSSNLQCGAVVSLAQSATGLAFCAFADSEVTQPLLEAEWRERGKSGGVTGGYEMQTFANRLRDAREHGLARSVGDQPSERHHIKVNAFSAPVYDAMGRMVLALSTTCRAEDLPPDWDGEVPRALLTQAGRLSARLGHQPKESS